MPIYITGRDSVPKFADRTIDHIISIGSFEDMPDLRPFRGQNLTVHRFVFDDVTSKNDDHILMPSHDIIKRMIRVFDSMGTDERNVLFHCAQGVSRSPAAAFIYLIRKGLAYESAYHAILAVRGAVQPNMLMIKIADEVMGHQGKMLKFVAVMSGRPDYTF